METISQFESIIDGMTIDFINHMYPDYIEEGYDDYYWIADDRTGTLEINDTYFSLSDIYEVLKNKYPKDKVFAWYDYSIYYSSKDNNLGREYYINMSNFMRMYDGNMEVKEFARIYKEKRDKDQFFWNSPAGKEKEQEIMKPLLDKFEKDISKLK